MNSLDAQSIWRQACDELKFCVTASAFQTWIVNNPVTKLEAKNDQVVRATITSPTPFQSATIQKQYSGLIQEVLTQLTGKQCELAFTIGQVVLPPANIDQDLLKTSKSTADSQVNEKEDAQSNEDLSPEESPPITPSPPASQNNIASTLQDRLRRLAEAPPAAPSKPVGSPSLFSASTIQTATIDRSRMTALKSGLRSDYTFESVAVSSSNEMAYAAAQAVAANPGQAYNPLFIYGNVGVGKTHLVHAIGNHLLQHKPEARILYCTGEDFGNEIIKAIQTKRALVFKEKYRTVDVLIVDDVWFIAGRNTVQEEFFHTFNALIKRASQIILTSDRPPQEINLMEDRLKSRFQAGLMVDIQQPSFELRTAILLIKAQNAKLDLSMEFAQLIASRIDTARRLEGVVMKIKSKSELEHLEITQELIEKTIQKELSTPLQLLRAKPADVIKTVSEHFHVKQIDVRGKTRKKEIVIARHLSMFIMNKDLQLSLVEIGRIFGQSDHTSSLHAIQKIEELLPHDQLLRQELEAVRTTLQSSPHD